MEGDKFAFDVGWIFSSSAFKLILGVITSLVMAYYIGASGLGLWVMLFSITSLSEVTNLGIPSATTKYVAEFKDDNTRLYQVVSASFILSIILGTLTAVALFILADRITEIFNMPLLTPLLKFFILSIPFNYIVGSVIATLNGLRNMKLVSLLNVTSQSLNFVFVIIPIILGYGLNGAIIGFIISTIIYTLVAMFFFRRIVAELTLIKFKETSKILLFFGTQTVLSSIVGIILYRIDILMIAYFLTPTDVGIYSVAIAIARMIWIIPQSINAVSFPTFSHYWGTSEHNMAIKLFDKALKYSLFMLAVIGFLLAIFGKDAILLLYGNMFLPAVLPLQILLIGAVVRGTIISIGSIWLSVGRPDMGYKLPLITVGPNILMNYILIPTYGIVGAAIATMLSFLFNAFVSLIFINRILRLKPNIKLFGKAIFLTILVSFVYLYFKSVNHFIIGILTFGLYLSLVWSYLMIEADRKYVIELLNNIMINLRLFQSK